MEHMPLQSLQGSLQSSPELLKDSASSLCPPRHWLCRKLWANPWETDNNNNSFESRHCFKMMRWTSHEGVPIAHHCSSKWGKILHLSQFSSKGRAAKLCQEIPFFTSNLSTTPKTAIEEYRCVTVRGEHTSTAIIYNQIQLSKPFFLSFYVIQ